MSINIPLSDKVETLFFLMNNITDQLKLAMFAMETNSHGEINANTPIKYETNYAYSEAKNATNLLKPLYDRTANESELPQIVALSTAIEINNLVNLVEHRLSYNITQERVTFKTQLDETILNSLFGTLDLAFNAKNLMSELISDTGKAA